MLYITTGGLFPDSFKQKAIACWMGGRGDGREKETSINEKGAGHHGNRHTNKVTWYRRGEQEGGEEGESKGGSIGSSVIS